MRSRSPAAPERAPAGAALPAPPPEPRAALVRFRLALAGLALATVAAFAGVVRNGWILFDDPEYVTENPHVTGGLTPAALRWALHGPHGGNWHPLTTLSHLVDVQLFGLAAGAHHAGNLALHAANVVLLALVLARLTGARWRAVLAAALWGLHPLRVESVAWASERKDVLSTLFFLLALLAYARAATRPGRWRLAGVAALLALGLAAKPMLVTAPLVLLLLDAWPLGRAPGSAPALASAGAPRPWLQLVAEKWPLFALAAAVAVVTFFVQRAEGGVVATANVPIGHRLANAVVSCVRYLALVAWPARLSPFYPDRPLAPALVLACAAALLGLAALAVWARRRAPALGIGLAWYAITLLPVIGLVQSGGQAYADRYTYIPSIGLMLALLWLPWPARVARAAAALALAAAALLGAATARQVALWRDTTTLFTAALEIAPDDPLAHAALGTAYLRAHRDADAERELRAAIRARPDFVNPYLNLAELLHREGRDAEAVRAFEIVRRSRPDDVDALVDEALALSLAGHADEAIALDRHALELRPDDVEAMRPLAILLAAGGRVGEALPLLRRAAVLAPRDAAVQHALAQAIYATGGAGAECVAALRRAIALRPEWSEPYATLALVLATDPSPAVRRPGEAVALAARAVALTHGADPEALGVQAAALAAAGQRAPAARAARAALALAARALPPPALPAFRARLAAELGHASGEPARPR